MGTENNMTKIERRYARQSIIANWGKDGQTALENATVFIAGAGGLGSPVSYYLATVGIGHIIICDMDTVSLSNLNRQILHHDFRIGINKAHSARMTLNKINPYIKVTEIQEKITENNIQNISSEAEIIVDCVDNYTTRYILMQEAFRRNIPLVHGSVWGLEGRISFFHTPETPCLKCVFPSVPSKEIVPIVGATAGVIGSLQAVEVIKYITGTGELMKNNLLLWDGTNNVFKKFKLHKRIGCSICGKYH